MFLNVKDIFDLLQGVEKGSSDPQGISSVRENRACVFFSAEMAGIRCLSVQTWPEQEIQEWEMKCRAVVFEEKCWEIGGKEATEVGMMT